MNYDTREYGHGTSITSSYPWGVHVTAKVMCSDGVVRKVKRIAQTADTFFSIPASVTVKGKTVAGYVTIETTAGSSVEMPDDPAVAKFIAYRYGKNFGLLPDGMWRIDYTYCREVAGLFHSGQWSALYAYASSGHIGEGDDADRLIAEIHDAIRVNRDEWDDTYGHTYGHRYGQNLTSLLNVVQAELAARQAKTDREALRKSRREVRGEVQS